MPDEPAIEYLWSVCGQDSYEVLKYIRANPELFIPKLVEFKKYVHKRLDDAHVPADPDPEHTKTHGCRIEGRLNWVLIRMHT